MTPTLDLHRFEPLLDTQRAAALLGTRPNRAWLFANAATDRLFHQEEIQKKHIRQAAKAEGITFQVGWKTFRHSYRSWFEQTEAPIGVQRELMRHASIQTAMNVYGRAMTDRKGQAHGNVVQMILQAPAEKGLDTREEEALAQVVERGPEICAG